MIVADFVVKFLEEKGIKNVFTVSGGGSIWQLWLADLAILQTLAQPFTSILDFLSSIQTQNFNRNNEEENVNDLHIRDKLVKIDEDKQVVHKRKK